MPFLSACNSSGIFVQLSSVFFFLLHKIHHFFQSLCSYSVVASLIAYNSCSTRYCIVLLAILYSLFSHHQYRVQLSVYYLLLVILHSVFSDQYPLSFSYQNPTLVLIILHSIFSYQNTLVSISVPYLIAHNLSFLFPVLVPSCSVISTPLYCL